MYIYLSINLGYLFLLRTFCALANLRSDGAIRDRADMCAVLQVILIRTQELKQKLNIFIATHIAS